MKTRYLSVLCLCLLCCPVVVPAEELADGTTTEAAGEALSGLLAMLPALGRGAEAVGMWLTGVTAVQLVVLVGSIFPVERALKKHFDKLGRKKES